MFRDLTNIQYIIARKRQSEQELINLAKDINCEKLFLGYMKLPELSIPCNYGKNWVKEVYKDANMDPDVVFNFYCLRDEEREEELYRRVIEYLGTTEYIVIQDCDKRGKVDRTKIPENGVKEFCISKGCSPVESSCMFDYRLVIERAQAYHGLDSGFSWIVELNKYNVPKKYLHMYAPLGRTDAHTFPYGYYRTEWTVLR